MLLKPVLTLLKPLVSAAVQRELREIEARLRVGGKLGALGELIKSEVARLGVTAKSIYTFECFDRFGDLKWREQAPNAVVTAGLNKLLDATLKTGLASPAWYVGLKDTGAVNAADTMASHAGWATITPYSNANDPAFTPGTISAGAVDNSASKAVFTINATDDVYGAFLKDNNTKGGTTGTLYGAADFGAQRGVASGDTLNVQINASVAAS